jgi:hypothetical protein
MTKDLERLDDQLVAIGVQLRRAERTAERLAKRAAPADRALLATLHSHRQQVTRAAQSLSQWVDRLTEGD